MTIDPQAPPYEACPYCENDQIVAHKLHERHWVECMGCEARGPVDYSLVKAFSAWNRRATPEPSTPQERPRGEEVAAESPFMRETLSRTANALHNAATELHYLGSGRADDYAKIAVEGFIALIGKHQWQTFTASTATTTAQPSAAPDVRTAPNQCSQSATVTSTGKLVAEMIFEGVWARVQAKTANEPQMLLYEGVDETAERIVAALERLALQPAPPGVGDLADILTMTGCRDREDLEDMARVGKSLLEAIAAIQFKGSPYETWHPADCPTEIVGDLFNDLTDPALSTPGDAQASGVVDRDYGGRLVREAWVRWALTQPNPKPTWLVPYDELSEPDKEADRQIAEALWSVHPQANGPEPSNPIPPLPTDT